MNMAFPVITDVDAARISGLGMRMRADGEDAVLPGLRDLIGLVQYEAEIVPREGIARDIVTVNSTVSFRDELKSTVQKVTLVYPRDVSIADRRISILSPVGRALLGRKVGALTVFGTPGGARRALRVLELHYQPEAAGNCAL